MFTSGLLNSIWICVRVWFRALKLFIALVCVFQREKEKQECVCIGLFVKALLPWACRLNMKGSLTWQALP